MGTSKPKPARCCKNAVSLPLTALLLFVQLWCIPAACRAVEVENVTFADTAVVDGTVLKLGGYGLLRYMVFVKAYVGAFYVPAGVDPGDGLADIAKRLEIEYFHPIQREDFAAATLAGIKKNKDPHGFQELLPAIDHMNRLYQDVQPGDRYTLTYLPGQGTELALNGIRLGTVPGADFAMAMFSIWLGDQPIDHKLNQRLLGNFK
jgi:hypothetical protein